MATFAVGDILVRNTLLGDSNLDGTVNFNDLLALAQNYNTANPANREWYHGNFNYDNAVNFDDLLVTAQNYNGVLTLDGEATDGWGKPSYYGASASWLSALCDAWRARRSRCPSQPAATRGSWQARSGTTRNGRWPATAQPRR